MTTNRRMLLGGALGVMLGALPLGALTAQSAQRWTGTRPAVESFYTQLRLAGDQETMRADGIGARLMWRPSSADPADGALRTLADRSELGVYATYTPGDTFDPGVSFSSFSLGVAMDVRPLEYPIAGRVEPFISMGAGVFDTNVRRAVHPAQSPLLERSRAVFTLTPGIGARIYLMPNLALQGDVRDMVTLAGDTRHNVAFGAGLRIGS